MNKNGKEIQRISGQMRDGVFVYKKGGIVIPVLGWKFFQKEDKIAVNYNEAMDLKGGKTVFMLFDGKDYRQIYKDATTATDSMSSRDFINDAKRSDYAERAMLTKPLDLQQILNILLLIVVGLLLLSGFWGIGNAVQNIQNLQAPFGKSINETVVLAHQNVNQTQQLIKLYAICVNSTKKV